MGTGKPIPALKTLHADRRLQVLIFLLFSVFAALIFRLWTIQIYQQEEFKQKSQNNIIREVPIPSKRGQILDRNGRVLVKDIAYWDAWIPIYKEKGKRVVTPDIQRSLEILSEILEVPSYETLKNTYLTKQRDGYHKHNRIEIYKKIPFDKYVILEMRKQEFPKEAMVALEEVPQRYYRYGDLAAHILGHTRQINAKEITLPKYSGYGRSDRIGGGGVEAQYEPFLRGKDGINLVKVNRHEIQQGQAVEIQPAVPGNDVVLSIDYRLQLAAERILGGSRGVIIAQDPRDGSILAMASSPRYDPNEYSSHLSKYSVDTERPLYHRAVQGHYPPGSVFKCIEMYALLEGMGMEPSHVEFCPGRFYLPGVARPWGCHKLTGHGTMDMYGALRLSCDVYFYKTVGMKLGIDRLAAAVKTLGLTEKTGIDLPEEDRIPIFPSRETKKNWYRGDTINVSIGQGMTLFSPIQISNAISSIVNRGTLYRPHVAKEIRSLDGHLVQPIEPVANGRIEAATKTWDVIHRAMWEVINTPNGTGRRIVDDPKKIAVPFIMGGKTGTAEDGKIREPHAWFVCYGPTDNPEIVVTVLVENAGHGGEVASPLAKQLIEVYLNRIPIEDLAKGSPSGSSDSLRST